MNKFNKKILSLFFCLHLLPTPSFAMEQQTPYDPHRSIKEMMVKSAQLPIAEPLTVERIFSPDIVPADQKKQVGCISFFIEGKNLNIMPEGIFGRLKYTPYVLALNENNFTTLPDDIRSLLSMNTFLLYGNPIETFPDGFYFLLENALRNLTLCVNRDQWDKIKADTRYNANVLQKNGGKVEVLLFSGSSYPTK